jgi:hypothetical protein
MEVKFFCPRWGSENIEWETFLKRVKEDGYSGIEWFPNGEPGDPEKVVKLLEKFGLSYSIVMTVIGNFKNFPEYLSQLNLQLSRLSTIGKGGLQPLFISAQTGREFFTADEIDNCLQCCREVSINSGIAIYQETHRNKWSYAAHCLPEVLERNEDVSLTLDVSHWFCVSESFLEDQQKAVDLAVSRTRHVHARIGYTQGSQVPDPALPEYSEALEAHLKIWDKWIETNKAGNLEVCTITPEFGPPPYLIPVHNSKNIHEQQWNLNLWMKNLLNNRHNNFLST